MPDTFLIDYIRVWQRPDYGRIGCDPASHPTAEYIAKHPEAYMNPNNTVWKDTGYPWPVSRFSLMLLNLTVSRRTGSTEGVDRSGMNIV